ADCILSFNPSSCPGDSQTFSLSVAPPAGSTIVWSITPAGASMVVSNDNLGVRISDATCGAFTLSVTITSGATVTQCSTPVAFVDTVKPALVGVPGNVNVACNAIPGVPTVTATDNCDPSPTVVFG